jgi:hypothetical protein
MTTRRPLVSLDADLDSSLATRSGTVSVCRRHTRDADAAHYHRKHDETAPVSAPDEKAAQQRSYQSHGANSRPRDSRLLI